ncbi:helix-turn-helix domain-containing protein [Enterococcus sp. AZ196]|uniref:helix-turn-helix domain-containing protein n=1 Tax=Enterococcus sp. AZ196 TaxID=2774659 RepID=UPI003D2727BA
MTPNKQKVGKRINEIRTNLGYSMSDFGKLIGDLPRSSVNNWEKGVSLPKKEKLEKIALLGNTSTDNILYGDLDEYLFDLIDANLHIQLDDDFLQMIVLASKPFGFSYHDDVKWLKVIQDILQKNRIEKIPTFLLYTPVGQNIYIAQVDNPYPLEKADISVGMYPIFYVYAEVSKNTLHVIPFPFNREKDELLKQGIDFITMPEEHIYFTKGFELLSLKEENSKIVFYGIYEGKINITAYDFDAPNDCYSTIGVDDIQLYKPFVEELEKSIAI